MTLNLERATSGPSAHRAAGSRPRDAAGAASRLSTIAWCGWRLLAPEDWRPLRLDGGPKAGSMMIGTATEAILSLRWARSSPARAERFWQRRSRRLKGEPSLAAPGGFTRCLLAHPAKKKTGQAIWLGLAREAGLLLELVYHWNPDDKRSRKMESLLPRSLSAQRPNDPAGTAWSIFGSDFVAPPGFALVGQSLHLGEISLRFARGKTRLWVGQVYPADLALARRPLGFWLRNWSGEEHALRRFRPTGEDQPWQVASPCGMAVPATPCAGLLRRGRKRVRWPLGFLGPRGTISVAVVEPGRGRILRAELESPLSRRHAGALGADGGESILRRAVEGMIPPAGEGAEC